MAEHSQEQPDPQPDDPHEGEPETHDAGELAEQALGGAQKAVDELQEDAAGEHDPADAQAYADVGPNVELPSFQKVLADVEESGIDLLHDVDLNVKIELGRTRMLVEDVLKLGAGSVIELDKLAGDPVDIYVNERLVARGEVLVLNDNFCVRISEIVADLEQLGPAEQQGASEAAGRAAGASASGRSTGG